MEDDIPCKTDWNNPRICVGTNERDETVHAIDNHGNWADAIARSGDDNIIVRVTLENDEIQNPWGREERARGDGSVQKQLTSGAVVRTFGGDDTLTLCVSDQIAVDNEWTQNYRDPNAIEPHGWGEQTTNGTHDSFMVNVHMGNGHWGERDADGKDIEYDTVTVKYHGDRLSNGFYKIDSDTGIAYASGNTDAVSYDPQTRKFSIMPNGIPMISISNPDMVNIQRVESEEDFKQCFGANVRDMLVSEVDSRVLPSDEQLPSPTNPSVKTVQKG